MIECCVVCGEPVKERRARVKIFAPGKVCKKCRVIAEELIFQEIREKKDMLLSCVRLARSLAEIALDTYYRSRRWEQVAGILKAQSGYTCKRCKKTVTSSRHLQVHHKTYRRRGYERPEDLEVLCAECHRKEHEK